MARRAPIAVGASVRVVEQADDTLPESFVGRKGRVVEKLPYQGVGDAKRDPLWLVQHRGSERQMYWTEELERR